MRSTLLTALLLALLLNGCSGNRQRDAHTAAAVFLTAALVVGAAGQAAACAEDEAYCYHEDDDWE